MLWVVAKPFLHPETVKKFRFFATLEDLHKVVPKSGLLKQCQGTLEAAPGSLGATPNGILPDLLPIDDGGRHPVTFASCTDYSAKRYELFGVEK
jgi:hypothetical protein